MLLGNISNLITNISAKLVQLRRHISLLQLGNSCNSGNHGCWVACKCSRLKYLFFRIGRFFCWCDYRAHNFLFPAVAPDGKATTNYFAECMHIRPHPKIFRCTTQRQSESRHNLIENKQDAVVLSDISYSLQEILLGRHTPHHKTCYRLKNDGCQLACMFFDKFYRRLGIIEGQYNGTI